ncbi:MAG: polysaccharide deacetylase family protein [Treponema sp.]
MKKLMSKLLAISICLNILMFTMLAGIGIYKRQAIKNYLEDFVYSVKYVFMDRSIPSQEYNKVHTPQKRYLALGFDDFRQSDFDMVIPLLKKYGATATFNRIAWNADPSKKDLLRINEVLKNGNELGDHTWFHCNYIFTDALCNGQNPDLLEGNQVPFPSNEQLRKDFGGGKNAFGLDLNTSVRSSNYGWIGYSNGIEFDTNWGDLTDHECQMMRAYFSIYSDKTGKLETFDNLSNRYLGTHGKSFGSWDDEKGCYTGGIFTGAKTSCNHEIWERILEITKAFYKEHYNSDFDFLTWSWPGDWLSPFRFQSDGKFYYDSEHTKLFNYLAQFESSITGKNRSYTQVLFGGGYLLTHDTFYPSRVDGTDKRAMGQQLIYNASFSRKDALPYSTNTCVSYAKIAEEYPEEYFSSKKTKAAQMYDGKGSFYTTIENLRHNTSNGMVYGEVIDSEDTYSERVFLEELLRYCKQTGVEVISKAKAFDVCFNHILDKGNLIYNPTFRNTAKEFLPDAECVSPNPDGYHGDCEVIIFNDNPSLKINGVTYYIHYGIPLGIVKYSAYINGKGNIVVYAIKNNSPADLNEEKLELLGRLEVESDSPKEYELSFLIQDNPATEYEQICAGLGEKIMGIKIVYSGELVVNDISLMKLD